MKRAAKQKPRKTLDKILEELNIQWEGKNMNVLLDEKLHRIRSLFSGFSPPIKVSKYSHKSDLSEYPQSEKMLIDLVVLEMEENERKQISKLKELRNFNPDIRAILFTSQNNRKYRGLYLSNGFDFFIFSESELHLLRSVVKGIHHRKTRAN